MESGYVKTYNGTLHISNPEGKECVVNSLDGKHIYSTASSNAEIRLPQGVYVVRIGDKVVKVMNK